MISAFLLAETALGTLVIPDLIGNPEALARLGLAEQTRISWIPAFAGMTCKIFTHSKRL